MLEIAPRVLVTRAAHQNSALADALRALGAEPVLLPAIRIVEPRSFEVLDAALRDLSRFDWLVFTSANAVEVFLRRGAVRRHASTPAVAAIGAATARVLTAAEWPVDLVPPKAIAESLAEALVTQAQLIAERPVQFLIVRAEEGREHLPAALQAAGAEVTVAPAYRTILADDSLPHLRRLLNSRGRGRTVDAITFTSSSSVHNFFALLNAAEAPLPRKVLMASIGPVTSETLREYGEEADVEATEATVDALAATIVARLRASIE